MTGVKLLQALKVRTESAISDLLMPEKGTKAEPAPESRVPTVYIARLPDEKSSTKYAPYVLHTIITTSYKQEPGEYPKGLANVRTLFCVYSPDEQEGGLLLLNLMERIRVDIMRETVVDGQFELDHEDGIEQLVYPDDTAPFYLGEMMTTWQMPSVRREVRPWLT